MDFLKDYIKKFQTLEKNYKPIEWVNLEKKQKQANELHDKKINLMHQNSLLQQKIKNKIIQNTEIPQNTGDLSEKIITNEQLYKTNKPVNTNDVNELVSIYNVRPEKKYSGNKNSIGNLDLETIPYASNPEHINMIKKIYNDVKGFDYKDMQKEFERLGSPLQHISGQISESLKHYGITPGEFVAVVRQDSGAGTRGKRAIENKNPGNVGNVDNGENIKFNTWIEGSIAAIRNLAERKVK